MNKEELTNFIKEHEEIDDFTGGVNESQIYAVQYRLSVELPDSYKWFLNTYGSGGLFGVDILGIGKSNMASVVIVTENYRGLEMSDNLVVIEDAGEYAYCLDMRHMENNECPIIAWNRQGGLDDYSTAKNFYEFLSQRLIDAKEVWEEEF
ncbi:MULTISPECIES: SMI1/KNR4 family protein [Bacillus]|uniref:SMI1/KNR4 family protein n=1 Tax=Bacillus TaxID=1386 RepID=UPI000868E032|nr:SMI1/KNR4 family protein [Bacillus wiedmannii]MBJ8118231.1 SMI1/KNR4 family protein [Bacillus cereus]RFB13232.1 SMI1/KNR4 family protein [Bacillus sp. OE]RFB23491.1 SMI1/KNR4 family protein [Bacillus sp. LB(2018)]RFB71789.1 SMI1/KNR4 family protein [Bacillus sp. AW]